MWKHCITLGLTVLLSSLLLNCWIGGATASTLNRDFSQPIQISADEEFLDLRQNIFRVEGHVEIHQGSLTILADKLTVEGFGDEQITSERLHAFGSPATYEQEIEEGVFVHAQADIIIYDAGARILTLEGNAQLVQSGNYLNAFRIIYNLEEQTVQAQRGEEKVRTSLQRPDKPAEQGNP